MHEVQNETGEIVVPANYNCPGQLVISGSIKGIDIACERMKAAGAKRALVLPVGGAFHSPLMEPAKEELKAAIETTNFHTPTCAVYQNVVAKAVMDKEEIKQNLIEQLTGAGSLDTKCTGNDRRWRFKVYRSRPRKSIAGIDPED